MFCLPSENWSALKERNIFFFHFQKVGQILFIFRRWGRFFSVSECGANSFHFQKMGQILFIFRRWGKFFLFSEDGASSFISAGLCAGTRTGNHKSCLLCKTLAENLTSVSRITDGPLYTDTRYNDKIRYNGNLTHETFPVGTRRQGNVESTSVQRHDVAPTLMRRCINVITLHRR